MSGHGIRRASHFGLCVSDLERSVRFYVEVFGFEEVARLSFSNEDTRRLLGLPDDGELDAVYLRREGWTLELLHYPRPGSTADDVPRPMTRTGLTHLSFVVESLEPVAAAAVAAGGTVLEDQRLDAALFVLDPDGTRIELVAGDFDPTQYAP